MTIFSCEKCGKEFNSRSHYIQHQKRKTPCVNESKVREMINKVVDEKIGIKVNQEKTIETCDFNSLKGGAFVFSDFFRYFLTHALCHFPWPFDDF